jgi:hypothetical protein
MRVVPTLAKTNETSGRRGMTRTRILLVAVVAAVACVATLFGGVFDPASSGSPVPDAAAASAQAQRSLTGFSAGLDTVATVRRLEATEGGIRPTRSRSRCSASRTASAGVSRAIPRSSRSRLVRLREHGV